MSKKSDRQLQPFDRPVWPFMLINTLVVTSLVLLMLWKNGSLDRDATLFIQTTTAENFPPGAAVHMSGFPIGKVARVSLLRSDRIRTEIHIRKRMFALIPSDSYLLVSPANESLLLGGTGLSIICGTSTQMLEDGAEIPIQKDAGLMGRVESSAKELSDLLNQVTQIDFGGVNNGLASLAAILRTVETNTLNELTLTLQAVQSELKNFDAITEAVDKLLAHHSGIATNLNTLIEGAIPVMTNVHLLVRNLNDQQSGLQRSMEHLAGITSTVDEGIDAETLQNVVAVIAEARKIAEKNSIRVNRIVERADAISADAEQVLHSVKQVFPDSPAPLENETIIYLPVAP